MSSLLTEGFSLSNVIVEHVKEKQNVDVLCSSELYIDFPVCISCYFPDVFFPPWLYCMWIAVDPISTPGATFLTVLSSFRRTADGQPVCRDLLADFEDQEQTGKI